MPADRKRAFQLKYALSLGLRPSSLDPRTHEVLAVQCAFCVAFGREPRAVNGPEAPENAADNGGDNHEEGDSNAPAEAPTPARRPPRARTSNVRSWAPPLRPDNIRLHMRAQHPARFSAYAALVSRAKEDGSFQAAADLGLAVLFPTLVTGSGELTAVAVSPAVTGAAREMLAFFGDALALAATPAGGAMTAPVDAVTTEAPAVEATTLVMRQRDAGRKSVPALLVKRVAVPAVMTELLETLVCLADAHIFRIARRDARDDTEEDDDEVVATRSGSAKRRRRHQGGRAEPPMESYADHEASSGGGGVVESNDRLTIRRLLPDDDGATSGRSNHAAAREKFEIDVKNSDELAKAQRLLAMRLSFEQTAQVMALTDVGSVGGAPLSAATVASFARVSVVSALEMISDLMRRSWTFAIVFDVCNRVSVGASALLTQEDADNYSSSPFYRAIDVCVRLPTTGSDGSNDALSFHVVALPMLPFEHSLERTLSYLTRYLDVLDPNWTRKLMGCCVNGNGAITDDPDTSFSASLLAQRVAHHALSKPTPEVPFYQLWQPAQQLTDVLQRALCEIKGAIIVNGVRVDTGFGRSLSSVTAFLRGQEPWMRAHGRCPEFDVLCPWSVLNTTRWMLARREAVNELYANTSQLRSTVYPSAIFWLVLFAVADVLTMFEHVWRELEAFPMPSGRESRRKLAESVRMLMDKTGVSRNGFTGSDDDSDCDFAFGENVSRLGRFEWKREPDLVRYVRSLNLSSRRLYSETSAASQGRAEFGITCFTLRVVHSISLLAAGDDASDDDGEDARAGSATVEAPPTLPLHFVELDRSCVVDLIERHSARLEKAFGSRFLDRISSDIERLRTLVGTASGPQASPFRLQLESAQARSFRDAWALLVPHGMASLRRFAAGLATVLPRTGNEDASGADGVRFPAGDEDQFRSNFADLAIEARLHCAQARRLTVDVHTR